MKNYYEILEVDKNASIEVIEKAYKALAKKYHPDLQVNEEKKLAEDKMKEINEAYEILSNEEKRKAYDENINELKKEIENEKIYEMRNKEVNKKAEEQKENKISKNAEEEIYEELYQEMNQEIRRAREQAYRDAYIQDLKQRGYRIKYKHGFKYYFKFAIGILVSCGVLFLVYQIPPIKKYCIDLYNENEIIKIIIDIVCNIFKRISNMFN